MEYDAELRYATWFQDGQLSGYIYNDRKGRWPDGTPIYTSAVLDFLSGKKFYKGDEIDGVYQTRNTKYKVTFARKLGAAQ